MKKRGQSGIITTVLIILLVLVAIIILWNVVMPIIQKSGKEANTNTLTNTVNLESLKLYPNGDIYVKVGRISGDQNIDSLQFIIQDSKGGIYKISVNNTPKVGESIPYTIKASDIKANDKISKVSVVPVLNNRQGSEAKDTDVSKKDSSGNIIPEIPANPSSIGLVSWWKFDGDTKDSVDGNDGTAKNGALQVNDAMRGNVMSFDGIDDYVNIIRFSDFSSQNGTISLWFKSNKLSANQDIIEIREEAYKNFTLIRRDSGNKISLVIEDGDIAKTAINSSAISNTDWHHVVISQNGTNALIYIDGSYQTSGTNSNYWTSHLNISTFLVGYSAWNYYFNGSLDNIMIFNTALNPDEIKAIYINQKS